MGEEPITNRDASTDEMHCPQPGQRVIFLTLKRRKPGGWRFFSLAKGGNRGDGGFFVLQNLHPAGMEILRPRKLFIPAAWRFCAVTKCPSRRFECFVRRKNVRHASLLFLRGTKCPSRIFLYCFLISIINTHITFYKIAFLFSRDLTIFFVFFIFPGKKGACSSTSLKMEPRRINA